MWTGGGGSSVLIQKSLLWNPLLQTVPGIESFTVRNDNTLQKKTKKVVQNIKAEPPHSRLENTVGVLLF